MTFRYLGNKARLADWITDIVGQHVPTGGEVADLMCGTASVATSLAKKGYRVTASDHLKFPTLHAKARLLSTGRKQLADFGRPFEVAVDCLNRLSPINGYFYREFGAGGKPKNGAETRLYFTEENAAKIDAIRYHIQAWQSTGLEKDGADLLLHALILAVNRVANISGTYGFYHKDWTVASNAALRLEAPAYDVTPGPHSVLQGDVGQVSSGLNVEAIYLDPPYTKRQYAGNYHLLETIALEDEPVVYGQGGLRDWNSHASDFCYRRKAAGAFRAVMSNANSRWVFISYSEDAQLPTTQLTELLSEYGEVRRFEHALGRYRSNARVSRQGNVIEYLFVVEMRNAASTESSGDLV